MTSRTCIALSILLLAGCASSVPSPQTAGQAETPIAQLIEAHDRAWNAHDPDALTALFTENGTLVTPRGKRVHGHSDLHALFASPGPTKQTTSRSTLDALQWLGDDLALIDATQTLEGPGVQMLGARRAKLVGVVQRVGGEWKFLAARPYVPGSRK